ncbi:hypothetical protein GCM10027075_53460 [Streptomyces heilongjiangensis]
MKSAGCSRVSATIRRITGEVRSRRGRVPGKDPYVDMPLRYARPGTPFTDVPSAPPPLRPVTIGGPRGNDRRPAR